MIVDYHMHLRNEREKIDHTVEAVERFVEHAQARAVEEIGFTEHVYYFRQTEGIWEVPYHVERCVYDLDPYVDAIVEAKRRGLPVKLGLEVDWTPEKMDELGEALAPYPWDYLLGSVHFVDGHGVDGEPRLIDAVGVERAWSRYFEELGRAAGSGLFQSLSHPDLVKIFGERAVEPAALHEHLLGQLDGVCLEVSSAGLHKPVGELYPDANLLERARRAGVSITLASDAHAPQNVGRDVDKAIEHARAAGYETVTVFEGRQPSQVPLG